MIHPPIASSHCPTNINPSQRPIERLSRLDKKVTKTQALPSPRIKLHQISCMRSPRQIVNLLKIRIPRGHVFYSKSFRSEISRMRAETETRQNTLLKPCIETGKILSKREQRQLSRLDARWLHLEKMEKRLHHFEDQYICLGSVGWSRKSSIWTPWRRNVSENDGLLLADRLTGNLYYYALDGQASAQYETLHPVQIKTPAFSSSRRSVDRLPAVEQVVRPAPVISSSPTTFSPVHKSTVNEYRAMQERLEAAEEAQENLPAPASKRNSRVSNRSSYSSITTPSSWYELSSRSSASQRSSSLGTLTSTDPGEN